MDMHGKILRLCAIYLTLEVVRIAVAQETIFLNVVSPEDAQDAFNTSLLWFETPDYEFHERGHVAYPTGGSGHERDSGGVALYRYACQSCNESTTSPDLKSGETSFFLLADHVPVDIPGDQPCTYEEIAWNAQSAGAKAVIVILEHEEQEAPDDRPPNSLSLGNITIPVALVSKSAGDSLQRLLQQGKAVHVSLGTTHDEQYINSRRYSLEEGDGGQEGMQNYDADIDDAEEEAAYYKDIQMEVEKGVEKEVEKEIEKELEKELEKEIEDNMVVVKEEMDRNGGKEGMQKYDADVHDAEEEAVYYKDIQREIEDNIVVVKQEMDRHAGTAEGQGALWRSLRESTNSESGGDSSTPTEPQDVVFDDWDLVSNVLAGAVSHEALHDMDPEDLALLSALAGAMSSTKKLQDVTAEDLEALLMADTAVHPHLGNSTTEEVLMLWEVLMDVVADGIAGPPAHNTTQAGVDALSDDNTWGAGQPPSEHGSGGRQGQQGDVKLSSNGRADETLPAAPVPGSNWLWIIIAALVASVLAGVAIAVHEKHKMSSFHKLQEKELEAGGTWDWRDSGHSHETTSSDSGTLALLQRPAEANRGARSHANGNGGSLLDISDDGHRFGEMLINPRWKKSNSPLPLWKPSKSKPRHKAS